MMITKIEFRIEGLNPEGEWHLIDKPQGLEGDHRAHLGYVISMLRHSGFTRYSKVRLVKHVTTVEVIGEDVTV